MEETFLYAPCEGLIIGKSNIPLVNEGDAMFHLALFEDWVWDDWDDQSFIEDTPFI